MILVTNLFPNLYKHKTKINSLAPIAVKILFGLPGSVSSWGNQKDRNEKREYRPQIKPEPFATKEKLFETNGF
jgi:hypothetical protein